MRQPHDRIAQASLKSCDLEHIKQASIAQACGAPAAERQDSTGLNGLLKNREPASP
jgi:hypothetical protein